MTVIDSHLRCPYHHDRMIQEIGQDDTTGEGAMRSTHIAVCCDYREPDRAWSRPLRTHPRARAEWLARKRLEGWRLDIAPAPALGEWLECPFKLPPPLKSRRSRKSKKLTESGQCPYKVWRNGDEPQGPAVAVLAEHVRTHGLDPVAALWPLEVPDGEA